MRHSLEVQRPSTKIDFHQRLKNSSREFESSKNFDCYLNIVLDFECISQPQDITPGFDAFDVYCARHFGLTSPEEFGRPAQMEKDSSSESTGPKSGTFINCRKSAAVLPRSLGMSNRAPAARRIGMPSKQPAQIPCINGVAPE